MNYEQGVGVISICSRNHMHTISYKHNFGWFVISYMTYIFSPRCNNLEFNHILFPDTHLLLFAWSLGVSCWDPTHRWQYCDIANGTMTTQKYKTDQTIYKFIMEISRNLFYFNCNFTSINSSVCTWQKGWATIVCEKLQCEFDDYYSSKSNTLF